MWYVDFVDWALTVLGIWVSKAAVVGLCGPYYGAAVDFQK